MVFKLSGDLNRWGIGKIGRGLINSEKDKFWLDIPKNASQTTIHGLTNRHPNDGKWVPINSENFKVNSIQKYLIVRDPIQRWVGSSVELAWHHHKTKSEGNFFARKNLKEWYDMHARPDLHHLPQWVWARHLDLHDNTTFIIMDNKKIKLKLNKTFSDYNFDVNVNYSEDNEFKKKIKYRIMDEFMTDHVFVDKLKDYYAEDYDLLELAYTSSGH